MTKLIIATVVSLFILSGCSKGETRVVEKQAHHCTQESSKERADFILQCINNANPKSDEEPEDWIRHCQYIAEETLCEEKTMLITEECLANLGCVWFEVDRKVKE